MTDIYTLALAIVREHERRRLEEQEWDELLRQEANDEARAEHCREVEYLRDHPIKGW